MINLADERGSRPMTATLRWLVAGAHKEKTSEMGSFFIAMNLDMNTEKCYNKSNVPA